MEHLTFKEYPSYNALDRTAMFMGVPLLPAVFLLVLGILIFLIGGRLLGITGFLFGFIVFPIFLFLRSISENDDKALYILYLDIVFKMKRVAFNEFGKTLTLTPEKYFDYEKSVLQNFKSIDKRNK